MVGKQSFARNDESKKMMAIRRVILLIDRPSLSSRCFYHGMWLSLHSSGEKRGEHACVLIFICVALDCIFNCHQDFWWMGAFLQSKVLVHPESFRWREEQAITDESTPPTELYLFIESNDSQQAVTDVCVCVYVMFSSPTWETSDRQNGQLTHFNGPSHGAPVTW